MKTPLPQSKRGHLARMMAQAFNDSERVNLYLSYCKKYPLSLVFRAFAEAKAVPGNQVRKSRAAIFFYLIKKYDHGRKQNLSH